MELSPKFLPITILALAIFAGCTEAPTAAPGPTTVADPTPTATAIPATLVPTLIPTPTGTPVATSTPSPTPPPTATATTTSTPSSATTVDLTIKNFRLEDRTVRVGDTVVWTQQDASSHTTTSGNSPARDSIWDSGTLQAGQSFSFTFDQTGEFPYFCTIHPSMTGVITVVGASDTTPSGTTPTPPTEDYIYD